MLDHPLNYSRDIKYLVQIDMLTVIFENYFFFINFHTLIIIALVTIYLIVYMARGDNYTSQLPEFEKCATLV